MLRSPWLERIPRWRLRSALCPVVYRDLATLEPVLLAIRHDFSKVEGTYFAEIECDFDKYSHCSFLRFR